MLIKSCAVDETIIISVGVARALVEFAGDDATRPALAIGVDVTGALCASDGHTAVRFPAADVTRTLAGRVWSRAYVAQELKIARARKDDTLVLTAAAALPAKAHVLPPIDQIVPRRGFGTDPLCMAGPYLGRIEVVVTAVHGVPRKNAYPQHGAHLVSALGKFEPLMWWVVDAGGELVLAQIIVMPMNQPLKGALAGETDVEPRLKAVA